ncbi:MAG: hypothetical protein IKR09_05390 [Alphaproteobacteria bacterium]|nr:hypothetical protein [Alphaproteobacteria bacterium]
MTNIPYFILLACVLVLNISVLYSYFLVCDIKTNETVHNDLAPVILKKAYCVQALTFLTGSAALFYFSDDKIWFRISGIAVFPTLLLLFFLSGYLKGKSKILTALSLITELAGMLLFTFNLSGFSIFSNSSLSVAAVKISAGCIWFVVFQFFRLLSARFDSLIVIQSLHIGFSSLLVLLLLPFTPVPLLQLCGILLPIMLMLAPFYCILQTVLPLTENMRNFFCLLLTGLAFFTIPAGHWGVGVLMSGYILFEIAVVVIHFMLNLIKKKKKPLFFHDNLMEKNASAAHIVVYYNFLASGLLFFAVYINQSLQVIILAVFMYFKMYLNIMSPKTANTGIIDLFKEAKKTAVSSIEQTSQTITDLKQTFSPKQGKDK